MKPPPHTHLRRPVAVVAAALLLSGPAAPAVADTQVIREQRSRIDVRVDSIVDRAFGPGCLREQRIHAFLGEDQAIVDYTDYSECDGDGRLIFSAFGPAQVEVRGNVTRGRLVATLPVQDVSEATIGTVTIDLVLTGTGAVQRASESRTTETPDGFVRVTERTASRAATVAGSIDTPYVDWRTLTSSRTATLDSWKVSVVTHTDEP